MIANMEKAASHELLEDPWIDMARPFDTFGVAPWFAKLVYNSNEYNLQGIKLVVWWVIN